MWQSPAQAVLRLAIARSKVIPVEAILPGVLPLPVPVLSVSTTVKSPVTLAVQGRQEVSLSPLLRFACMVTVISQPSLPKVQGAAAT